MTGHLVTNTATSQNIKEENSIFPFEMYLVFIQISVYV